MRKPLKQTVALFLTLLVLGLFQNCGESLDLSSLEEGSLFVGSNDPQVSIGETSRLFVANSSYEILLEVQNVSSYTIQWYKDDNLLQGFGGESLVFEPAAMSDAGEYYATVQISENVQLISERVTVTVEPDSTLVSYPFPFVLRAGTTTPRYYLASNPDMAGTLTAYCRAQLGPSAISTGHTLNTQVETINYTAIATGPAACAGGVYQNGLCLRFDPGVFEPELRATFGPFVIRVSSVTCRPQPIVGL